GGPAGRRHHDALAGPEGMAQPEAGPALQGGGIPDKTPVDGCFQAPGLAEAADGESRIAELEESEVHGEGNGLMAHTRSSITTQDVKKNAETPLHSLTAEAGQVLKK